MKEQEKRQVAQKVEDKSVNLDVQGQGCWDDCTIYGHWENNTSAKSCNWIGTHTSPVTNPML